MKTVVVDWDITYPTNSGKRLRTLNFMLQLAEQHEITYFSRGDGDSAEGKTAREFLNDHGIRTVFANAPIPAKTALKYYGRLAANLFAELPAAVTAHRSTKFRRALHEYAHRHDVDLWQLEWTPYVDMLNGLKSARSLIVAHNVDALIWQRYYEAESNSVRRWFIKNQWQKFLRFEKNAYHRADGVVAVSPDDAAILRDDFGVAQVDTVDNGVDVDHYRAVTDKRDPRELLFLGSLDWRPNLDAIPQLLDDILPRVHIDEPDVRLTLVGRNPPDWLVKRVSALPHVELCADVPDVRPYLAKAGIMVVPLRIGGGSRLKILEALASGLPVVSTRVGAEGLRLTPDEHIRIADTADEMASAIVHWVRNPQDAEATAQRGHEVAYKEYDWSKLAVTLEAVWFKTAASPTSIGA